MASGHLSSLISFYRCIVVASVTVNPDELEYIFRKRTADFETEQLALVCGQLGFIEIEQTFEKSEAETRREEFQLALSKKASAANLAAALSADAKEEAEERMEEERKLAEEAKKREQEKAAPPLRLVVPREVQIVGGEYGREIYADIASILQPQVRYFRLTRIPVFTLLLTYLLFADNRRFMVWFFRYPKAQDWSDGPSSVRCAI